ncbi:MAG: T9SS type A sorting domain-containing protein [Ignavibacteriaceae bacterium]
MKAKLYYFSLFLFLLIGYTTYGQGSLPVPVLSWPIANTTEYTNPPTFNWYLNTSSAGLTYQIQCVVASDPWPADNVYATSSTISFTMPYSLSSGVQYAWRVRSTDGTTTSDWSTYALFTMVENVSVPSIPIASWPVGNTTEYTNPPTLNWYMNTSSTGLTYQIQCVAASDPWPDDNTYATSSIMSFTMPYLLTSGVQYAWRVRSTDGTTTSDWSTYALFTMVANASEPSVPIVSWPAGNTTEYTNPPTLNWYMNTSSAGLSYQIQYVAASDPWPDDNTYAISSTISFTMPYSLTSGVQYAWRVRSTDGTTTSDWSTYALFTMVAIDELVQPITGSPANSVKISTGSPELFWYLPTATKVNSTYEVELASDTNFSNAKTFSSSKSFVQVNGLSVGNYYWKVRSKDSVGNTSSYSGVGKFSVKMLTAVDNKNSVIPKQFAVSQNYPNPFNPSTVINYALPKSSNVIIKIYNILGQEVKTLINSESQAGYYAVQWNGDNNFGHSVSSGVYIYRVEAGQYIKTMKMMLLK